VLQLLTTEYAMEIFFPLLDKEIAPPYSEEWMFRNVNVVIFISVSETLFIFCGVVKTILFITLHPFASSQLLSIFSYIFKPLWLYTIWLSMIVENGIHNGNIFCVVKTVLFITYVFLYSHRTRPARGAGLQDCSKSLDSVSCTRSIAIAFMTAMRTPAANLTFAV
jgi:hypothetical protein